MSYTSNDITVLSGLEAIRYRPSMYIGSTSLDGVHHLVNEVVQNAVDEAMAGAASRIRVTLGADGSIEIADNGRGSPTDPHPEVGRPACEVVLTHVHSGGKFGGESYDVSGGLHGVGLSCVNALSVEIRFSSY